MARVGKNRLDGGATVIEAALVIPLLLLLSMALIEYGWMFLKAQQTTGAARQGARLGVRPDVTTAEARAAVSALMNSAGLGTSGYTVTFSPADVAALPAGQTLTVEITVPYQGLALVGTPFVPVPSTIRSSVSMAKEGP